MKSISNQRGNTRNSMIMLVALLVNTLVIGGGGVMIWRQKKQAEKEQQAQEQAANPKAAEAPVEENKNEFKKIIPFESVLTSLHGDNGRRMIRVGLQVQLEGNGVMDEVAVLKPQLRDAILVAVGDFDASDADRPEGKDILKQNILTSMNRILKKGKATDLFFTEFETN